MGYIEKKKRERESRVNFGGISTLIIFLERQRRSKFVAFATEKTKETQDTSGNYKLWAKFPLQWREADETFSTNRCDEQEEEHTGKRLAMHLVHSNTWHILTHSAFICSLTQGKANCWLKPGSAPGRERWGAVPSESRMGSQFRGKFMFLIVLVLRDACPEVGYLLTKLRKRSWTEITIWNSATRVGSWGAG